MAITAMNLAIIAGDGIGPDVIAEAVKVLDAGVGPSRSLSFVGAGVIARTILEHMVAADCLAERVRVHDLDAASREALLKSDVIPGDLARLSPIVTPEVTTQLTPNQQFEPIRTGPLVVNPCQVIGRSGSSKRWLASPTKQPLANIT